jgi:hypothetical protein
MKLRMFLVVALFLSGSALSAEVDNKPEKLNFFVPKGWKIAHEAQEKDRAILEIIPEKQTVESWTRMITVQTFGSPEKYQPESFINGMGELAKKACAGVALIPVRNGQQNGFSFSQKILLCTKNQATNNAETMDIKAIKGEESFYVVQVASRTDMPRDEMQYWALYLRDVVVSRKQ